MVAAISITPASGSITAKRTFCRVTVTGADQNNDAAFNSSLYPASPELRYYLLFDAPAGTDDGKSYVFGVGETGGHVFNNYMFPASGSWTIRLRNAANDSDVATAAVTVS